MVLIEKGKMGRGKSQKIMDFGSQTFVEPWKDNLFIPWFIHLLDKERVMVVLHLLTDKEFLFFPFFFSSQFALSK